MKNGSLRKQPTFRDAATGFLEMTPEETSAEIPYWWRVSTTIYVVLLIGRAATRHQYGISAVVSQTSFRGNTSTWWRREMSAVP